MCLFGGAAVQMHLESFNREIEIPNVRPAWDAAIDVQQQNHNSF